MESFGWPGLNEMSTPEIKWKLGYFPVNSMEIVLNINMYNPIKGMQEKSRKN